jgi:hypothetical protein
MLSHDKVTHLVYSQNYKESGISRGDVVVVERLDIEKNRVYGRVESTGRNVLINPDRQHQFSPYKLEGRQFAVGDLIETRANIDDYLIRGRPGVVTGVSGEGIQVRWDGKEDRALSSKEARFVDYAYAHTSQKEQGQSLGVEIPCISETGAKAMSREGNLVIGTRAKYETIVVTSAKETMLKNASKEPVKTTAMDIQSESSTMGKRIVELDQLGTKDHASQVHAPNQGFSAGKDKGVEFDKGGAEHSL